MSGYAENDPWHVFSAEASSSVALPDERRWLVSVVANPQLLGAREARLLAQRLLASEARVVELQEALRQAQTALRNAQTERSHGATANHSFIERCERAAMGAIEDGLRGSVGDSER